MLHRVKVEPKALDEYWPIVGNEEVMAVRALAESLRGARVLHVNATAFGGGVAEMLSTLVPLINDVGLDAQWQVIAGSEEFFNVTKAFHNGLQGMDLPLSEEMKEIWRRYNQKNAEALEGEYDFVVMHDPQPAGLRYYHGPGGNKRWIWRSHIDTSHPHPAFWEFITPFLQPYDARIFSMEQYVGEGLHLPQLAIIRPSIDPLSPKNTPLPLTEAQRVVADLGIDLDRTLISQISRYDPWKDPMGVIDAYRLVKEEMPEVQLALMASMASDDPEGWEYLKRTKEHAGDDPDIHVTYFERSNDLEVNALQTFSHVVIQKSIREGFGLVVTEAMWKGQAVVGGNVGGIPQQIIDGENGFLVNNIEECADRVLYLLQNPKRAKEMGAKAREHVLKRFLSPRHLKDYLRLFTSLR
jgi:trehalose synthase